MDWQYQSGALVGFIADCRVADEGATVDGGTGDAEVGYGRGGGRERGPYLR